MNNDWRNEREQHLMKAKPYLGVFCSVKHLAKRFWYPFTCKISLPRNSILALTELKPFLDDKYNNA